MATVGGSAGVRNEEKREQNQPVKNSSNPEEIDQFISNLPKVRGWPSEYLYKYKNFWTSSYFIKGLILAENNFIPKPNNVILSSYPKAGTTWFQAILSAIINRENILKTDHHDGGSASKNPRHNVPRIESYAFADPANPIQPDASSLYATHVPYASLPESIRKNSQCPHPPIVYVCRNPKDLFVSLWHFSCNIKSHTGQEGMSMHEAFELFTKGISTFGPYWDHVLEHWKLSLEFPEKFMFVKYEDMKRDPVSNVKRMAEFIGHGFSEEEEIGGVAEEIVRVCSFENMKKEGDKEGEMVKNITTNGGRQLPNEFFFRKGSVGDYKNYLNDDMIMRLESITKEKFQGTGLTLLEEW